MIDQKKVEREQTTFSKTNLKQYKKDLFLLLSNIRSLVMSQKTLLTILVLSAQISNNICAAQKSLIPNNTTYHKKVKKIVKKRDSTRTKKKEPKATIDTIQQKFTLESTKLIGIDHKKKTSDFIYRLTYRKENIEKIEGKLKKMTLVSNKDYNKIIKIEKRRKKLLGKRYKRKKNIVNIEGYIKTYKELIQKKLASKQIYDLEAEKLLGKNGLIKKLEDALLYGEKTGFNNHFVYNIAPLEQEILDILDKQQAIVKQEKKSEDLVISIEKEDTKKLTIKKKIKKETKSRPGASISLRKKTYRNKIRNKRKIRRQKKNKCPK